MSTKKPAAKAASKKTATKKPTAKKSNAPRIFVQVTAENRINY